MNLLPHAASWLLALVLGIVLTVLLQDKVHWSVARFFGRLAPRAPRLVRGIWRSTYDYQSNGVDKQEHQIIVLRQIGKRVWGRNITGAEHWYRVEGSLDMERYLTGTWANETDNDVYHGAFQFAVSNKGDRMVGKWLGFNDRAQINHGGWEWQLITRDTDESAQLRVMHTEQSSRRAG